jgi:hypothetical protein
VRTRVYGIYNGFLLLMLAVLGMTCAHAGQDPVGTAAERIAGRAYPSVFQAWNPADNLKGEDPQVTVARHDLVFHGAEFFKLRWNNPYQGLATGFTPKSITEALARRASLLKMNPHMILLLEIRYRDAQGSTPPANWPDAWKKHWRGYLPDDHPWWKRDAAGKRVMGWAEGGYIQLDFANPQFREQVATQCAAAVRSGVVDGVMLDWWDDDDARLALVRAIRARIGEGALILANANDRTTPRTAPYLNGYFMECYRSQTAADWARIAETLQWAEGHLRAPRINCLESWYHQSREDLPLMRAITTLSLTLSNGYCLFSDPNPLPTPDHLHNWYPFWERRLGTPVAAGAKQPNGTIRREFTAGTVVYNPMGNGNVAVTFDTPHRSVATGRISTTHLLADCDGDLFLLPPTAQPHKSLTC